MGAAAIPPDPPAAAKPSGKPMWMEYADLAAKIFLPVALLAATTSFNDSQSRNQMKRQDRASCLDSQFRLAALPKDAAPGLADTLWDAISEVCQSAGRRPLPRLARQVADNTRDAGSFARASVALGQPLSVPKPAAAGAAPPVVDSAPAPGLRPRVYIQIQDEAQRPAAQQLRAALNASTLDGRAVLAPGVERPPNGARSRVTEIRCAGDDCRRAPELAAYVASLLRLPQIPVRDISNITRPGASRPGHYELWLGPGPVALSIGRAAPASAGAGLAAPGG